MGTNIGHLNHSNSEWCSKEVIGEDVTEAVEYRLKASSGALRTDAAHPVGFIGLKAANLTLSPQPRP